MDLPIANNEPNQYGTFGSNSNDTEEFVGRIPDLETGVDFARLRSFLPKKTSASGSDSGFSLSLGDTPVELKSLTRTTSNNGSFSCSLPLNTSIQVQDDIYPKENWDSSCPTTPQSVASDSDNILAESESQCKILFAFIERGVDSIYFQLEKITDCVIVPLDHYANMSSVSTYTGSDRDEMSKEDLEAGTHSCDGMLTSLRQLKNCLMVNLTHLYGILDAYDRAYPEDRHLVAKFRNAKSLSINGLTGQLEHCQNAVQEHKRYMEARLRVVSWDDLMEPQHQRFVLFSLIHFIIFLVGVAALAWYAGYKDRYIGLFYLYRGPMFVTLYFYFYSVNLVGWATAKIRYIDIFGFASAGETPTPYVMFNIAGILSITFTIFVALLMFTIHVENSELEKSKTEEKEIPERVLPLFLWVITTVVLLNPFKWLIRKGRWGVIKVTLRILLAPLYRVRFGDFWFADQLNSIVVILLDIEFMMCFYSYVWPLDRNEDGKVCNKNTYIVRPVISCLPAFWRLMQCLRCYYDTRHYPHLINAGKYFTTFPVVIFFALYTTLDHHPRHDEDILKEVMYGLKHSRYLTIWVISAFVHATYTFIWDVYMDWGLLQSRNLLRPKLGYSWKSLYYVAIVEDFILRFAWSLKLSLGLHLQANVNLFYSLLAGLEIFRRFVWNFYRVEYEFVKITTSNEDGDEESNISESNISEKKSLLQYSIN